MERPEDYPAIRKWVDDVVIPTLNASPLKGHLLFVKNSLYSNKFDARTYAGSYSQCTDRCYYRHPVQ